MPKSGFPLIDAPASLTVGYALMTKAGSRFTVFAVFALALVLATRWCILTLYSETHAPTSARATAAHIELAHPVQESAPKVDVPYSAMTPTIQAAQASAGS